MHDKAHPIFRLPIELVQAIFIQCSYFDQDEQGLNIPNKKLAPLLLSQVSGTWRKLTLRTPELWYRLSLEWTTRKRWSPALIGELWLSRCESIPIMLSVHECQDGYHPKNQGINFALKYTKRLSFLCLTHEWTARSLQGPDQVFTISDSEIRFPLLKRLELNKFSGSFFAQFVNSIRCPKLEHYRVDCLHSLLQNPGISSSHLVRTSSDLSNTLLHLHILGVSMTEDDLSTIANTFLSLRTISITLKLTGTTQGRNDTPQTIRFLTVHWMQLKFTRGYYFSEEADNEGDVTLVLSHLFLPRLKFLKVSYDTELTCIADYWIAPRLNQFLQRSQCPLEELHLLNWNCDKRLDGERMLELATSVPTLRKFASDLTFTDLWGQMHRLRDEQHPLLRIQGGTWEVFPLLEELESQLVVGNLRFKEEETALLDSIDVLKQRLRGRSGRLKRCYVNIVAVHATDISEGVMEALDSLLPLGFAYHIEVLDPSSDCGSRVIQVDETPRFLFTPEEVWVAYPRADT